MRLAFFYHSLISDWNHGNAHFLRGVVTELLARGHAVEVYEPKDGWSLQNLLAESGARPLQKFQAAYPELRTRFYEESTLDLDSVLEGVDLVLVHEWNSHHLVRRLGAHRAATKSYRLLFHDTHHRSVTDRKSMAAYDLKHYDGVLAFGHVLCELYRTEGWTPRAWTWHEAADIRRFHPHPEIAPDGDMVWIGNWGDDERTAELQEFLLNPVRQLRLKATVHGVRYPADARRALSEAGIAYAGWLPNFEVPRTFAHYRVTLHIPRRPYVRALPGIPTIRVFEALACGIPLLSAPWEDAEGLFQPGQDFLFARDGREMPRLLQALLSDDAWRRELSAHGLATVRARHTCAHRVDELLAIYAQLQGDRQNAVDRPAPHRIPQNAVACAPACTGGNSTL